VGRLLSCQDFFDDRWRQKGQSQNSADIGGIDFLGRRQIRDRAEHALVEEALLATYPRDDLDHSVIHSGFALGHNPRAIREDHDGFAAAHFSVIGTRVTVGVVMDLVFIRPPRV
jgi:hypothetical protein